MKENATHIRLIRDDGKPVEAQYVNPHGDLPPNPPTSAKTNYPNKKPYFTHRNKWRKFNEWAEANRIPVTGDWPTDKNVFAMSEVEEVGQVYLTWLGEWISPSRWLFEKRAVAGEKTRTALRLKATLSDDRQSEVREQLGRAISSADKLLDFLGDPKQEAKTALLNKLADKLTCPITNRNEKACAIVSKHLQQIEEQAKQQYQQELIEKLKAEKRPIEDVVDLTLFDGFNEGIDTAIEIIQSTK